MLLQLKNTILKHGYQVKIHREVTSCSNTTSFQARRLNIRAKSEGETKVLHTLNGTAIAVGRILIALIENNQTEDGKVKFSNEVAEIIGVKNLGQ